MENLENFNIKYLININNTLDNSHFVSFNISVDNNIDYFNLSTLINIDFDKTNDFIITALQNKSNILICSENYNISFLIIGAFLIKYLNMSFSETLYYISKKSNINDVSNNVINQLFLYFQKN